MITVKFSMHNLCIARLSLLIGSLNTYLNRFFFLVIRASQVNMFTVSHVEHVPYSMDHTELECRYNSIDVSKLPMNSYKAF